MIVTTIDVTNILSKIYEKILKNIIEEEYGLYEIEQQSRFRTKLSCMNNIFNLEQLAEKKVATNRKIHLLFIDLTKAYDNVPISKPQQVFEQTNINNTIITAIKQLYENFISKVKIGNTLSVFPSEKVLDKGAVYRFCLSLVYYSKFIQIKHNGEGLVEYNQTMKQPFIHFADDQIVVQDIEDLEFMNRHQFEEYETWDLSVNMKKIKYLYVESQKQDMMLNTRENPGM